MGKHQRVAAVLAILVCALAATPGASAVDIDKRDVTGTPSDDVLRGTSRDDRLWAGDGYDLLFGKGGEDRMWGGPARDRIYAGNGDDLLSGSSGRDLLAPGRGRDQVRAGAGRDIVMLDRDAKADTIVCGPGRDLVRLGSRIEARDRLHGCEQVRHTGLAGGWRAGRPSR